MRVERLVFVLITRILAEQTDHHEASGGISLSVSRTTTKGHVDHPEDSTEVHEESSTSKTAADDITTTSVPRAEQSNSQSVDDGEAVPQTNTTESVQSIDDASTRSLGIAHQTVWFFENLQNVSLTISQLGLEGISVSTNIRTLSSYTELLIKCLEHLESLQSQEKELTEYITVESLDKEGRTDRDSPSGNKTLVETLEVTEETRLGHPTPRNLLEYQLAPLKKAKAKIQDKVEKKIEKKIMEHITGSNDSSPKSRALIEVGLESPFNIRQKLKDKFGKKPSAGGPEARSMMEVGLGAVIHEELEKSQRTRVVRRNPRTVQQVHKTTNINIDIKGIFKKARKSSGNDSQSHQHETHIHQQQVFHHHTPANTGCITCHYNAYYGAYR